MIHLRCGYKHISGDLLSHNLLCQLMFEGIPVPNSIINDLIAEAMVAAAEKSEVKHFMTSVLNSQVVHLSFTQLPKPKSDSGRAS